MSKRNKRLMGWIALCSLAALALSCGMIAKARQNYLQEAQAYTRLREIAVISEAQEEETQLLNVDFDRLLDMNPDCMGWIEIPGTGISYPVVQGEDNDQYLRRDFAGNKSVGGVIFLDYRSSGDFSGTNTVIYGHNMRDGSMFGSLAQYLDPDFAKLHPEIRIYTPQGLRSYTVFAAYTATTGWDCFTFQFQTDLERENWIQSQCAHALYDTGIRPGVYDEIITLVTCVGGENEYRNILQAVRVDCGEEAASTAH